MGGLRAARVCSCWASECVHPILQNAIDSCLDITRDGGKEEGEAGIDASTIVVSKGDWVELPTDGRESERETEIKCGEPVAISRIGDVEEPSGITYISAHTHPE